MTKPTPAQRRLLEEYDAGVWKHKPQFGTIRTCVRNGWLEYKPLGLTITPAGLEALK
jgi:hypothetical protein